MHCHRSLFRKTSVCLLITLLAAAAAIGQSNAKQTPVAKVAEVTLTQADLEKHLEDQLMQLELQRAKLLEEGLGPLVEKTLIEQAAVAAGKSTQDYLTEQIDSRTTPVTDAAVDAWYEQNKSRLRGQTKEALAVQIKQFLQQSSAAEARATLVSELRSELAVEIYLEPTRIEMSDAGATIKGPDSAPVTIVEFSDFECPACRGFNPVLTQVLDKYGDDVRVVFRQYPLRSIHPKAQKAAEAALCARDQDKFWELHDSMFGDQRSLDIASLKAKAAGLGMNVEGFNQCLDSGQYAATVQSDLDLGTKIGVSGTPAVYINGRVVAPGRVPSFGQMASLIDEELIRAASAKGD